MNWRKWNHILHRDIGFLCIGLTLIYAISGIAVNHISHSWNPSYTIEKVSGSVSALPKGAKPDMAFIEKILDEINETGAYKNATMISPGSLRIFVEGNTIDLRLATGQTTMEKVDKIPILYELNYLHLNKGKGIWTWLADIYGVALCILALSGILMIKGKKKKRGILLTSIGFFIPLIYLWFVSS